MHSESILKAQLEHRNIPLKAHFFFHTVSLLMLTLPALPILSPTSVVAVQMRRATEGLDKNTLDHLDCLWLRTDSHKQLSKRRNSINPPPLNLCSRFFLCRIWANGHGQTEGSWLVGISPGYLLFCSH